MCSYYWQLNTTENSQEDVRKQFVQGEILIMKLTINIRGEMLGNWPYSIFTIVTIVTSCSFQPHQNLRLSSSPHQSLVVIIIIIIIIIIVLIIIISIIIIIVMRISRLRSWPHQSLARRSTGRRLTTRRSSHSPLIKMTMMTMTMTIPMMMMMMTGWELRKD